MAMNNKRGERWPKAIKKHGRVTYMPEASYLNLSRFFLAVLFAAFVAGVSPVGAEEVSPLSMTPQGRYVDMDGYRLHYFCRGNEDASFTVLLESGIGGSIDEWSSVQDALAEDYRVCAYDRGGYGWSDPGPGARVVTELASELNEMLSRINITTPIIFVGHSFGGFIVRYYAHTWPDNVAGLVFVDSSLSGQLVEIGAPSSQGPRNPINGAALPENDRARSRGGFLNSRRKAVFAQISEFRNFERSAEIVSAAAPLPTVQAVVLSRDRNNGAEWVEAQAKFAESLAAAEFRIVPDAGHAIHIDKPNAVVNAVRGVVPGGLD